MIELTTGIALVMSSIAGSQNDTVLAKNIHNSNLASTPAPIVETLEASSTAVNAATSTDPAPASVNTGTTLEAYVREYYTDTPALAEIARCESQFTHFTQSGNVMRGRVDSNDVGVMQINERYHQDDALKLGYDIHTVEGNLAYAKYLFDKEGTAPWKASKPCWNKSVVALTAQSAAAKPSELAKK